MGWRLFSRNLVLGWGRLKEGNRAMKSSSFPGNCGVRGVGGGGPRCPLSSGSSWGSLCLTSLRLSPRVSGSLERGQREGRSFVLAGPAAPVPLVLSQAGQHCRAVGCGENE